MAAGDLFSPRVYSHSASWQQWRAAVLCMKTGRCAKSVYVACIHSLLRSTSQLNR